MALQKRTVVEYLKIEYLTAAEVHKLIDALRYQDAELAEFERSGEVPLNPGEVELSLSVEDARAELHRAEREGRLRIEWKRGWLYFFYCPPLNDPDGELAGVDMCEFLTRVPRAKSR